MKRRSAGDLYAGWTSQTGAAVYYGLLFDLLIDRATNESTGIYNRFLSDRQARHRPGRNASRVSDAFLQQKQNHPEEAIVNIRRQETFHERGALKTRFLLWERIAQLDAGNLNRQLRLPRLPADREETLFAGATFLRAGRLRSRRGVGAERTL